MKTLVLFLFVLTTFLYSNTDRIIYEYGRGNYDKVISDTELITDHDKLNGGIKFLYRGLAFFNLKKFNQSVKTFKQFIELYPNSNVRELVLYHLGLAYYGNENYSEALNVFDKLSYSSNSEFAHDSMDFAKRILELKMSSSEMLKIEKSITSRDLQEIIIRNKNSIDILVVLPLSGEYSASGKEILNGLSLCMAEKDSENTKKVKLDVINSESNIVSMVKKFSDKMKSNRYDLIVGELNSDMSAVLTGLADAYHIPVIIPVASQKIIPEISENAFQMNTSSYSMGSRIAEYAIDSLGYKVFATLAPMSNEGKESVNGFVNKVLEKDAQILSSEWYYNSDNLNRQFKRIREMICETDSLDVEKYMSDDSIKYVTVGVVDAFFMPIDFDEMEQVVPQFAYNNFSAKILGTYGWHDDIELYKVRDKVDSLIFADESSYQVNNSAYINFADKYREKYGIAVSRLSIKGYDTGLLLKAIIKSDNADISEFLRSLTVFKGIGGSVLWDENRTNKSVELFRYLKQKGLEKIID